MPPPRRPRALWPRFAAVPLLAAAGWTAYSRLAIPHRRDLPPALPGDVLRVDTPAGQSALYADGPGDGTPLLLLHSINAAASADEVRPLYLHYRATRPVYALDLPGFGLSDRPDRIYTPRLMADAIHAATALIRSRHGGRSLDALALSLSCEYLARAALEEPDGFRSLAFISPVGFDARLSGEGAEGEHRGRPDLRRAVSIPLWSRPLFDLLVTRPSMRYFLEKTWGGKQIDEPLLAYGHRSAHQPGAEHAPWSFLAGFLFADDATRLYKALRLPVWSAHGVRGDFVDYRYESEVAGRTNWVLDRFDTGAFPQFEATERVTARYDRFVAGL